jgi:hypothetical protein
MSKKKLQEELNRFNQIYKYNFIVSEQEAPIGADVPPPPAGDVPPPPPGGDVPAAPPIEETPPSGAEATLPPTDETEEIDITDLVNMTKSIKKELESKKADDSGVVGKMDDIFTKLNDLEQKIASMDSVIEKIDMLGSKVEQMKPKSPEEKLELRSLDSYPFNQNPQQFFGNKQGEMRQTGKNERSE